MHGNDNNEYMITFVLDSMNLKLLHAIHPPTGKNESLIAFLDAGPPFILLIGKSLEYHYHAKNTPVINCPTHHIVLCFHACSIQESLFNSLRGPVSWIRKSKRWCINWRQVLGGYRVPFLPSHVAKLDSFTQEWQMFTIWTTLGWLDPDWSESEHPRCCRRYCPSSLATSAGSF